MLRTFCRRSSDLVQRRLKKVCTSPKYVYQCSSWSAPEISKEDFKYVERLIPRTVVPEPPKHDSYPTPSGWVPAAGEAVNHAYYVRRTRFHHLPVYLEITDGGTRHITTISKIEGDIWKLEEDLKTYMEELEGKKLYTAVDELVCRIRIRGAKLESVKNFMLDKGF